MMMYLFKVDLADPDGFATRPETLHVAAVDASDAVSICCDRLSRRAENISRVERGPIVNAISNNERRHGIYR
jgi:hypothetical protein